MGKFSLNYAKLLQEETQNLNKPINVKTAKISSPEKQQVQK
jgi:hypothetical protein